jgi:hypothetical protein
VRHRMLFIFTILPGIAGVMIFGYYALIDWQSLQKAYSYFATVSQNKAALETLFVAEAQQNIHRINLFADGVWTLLSGIIAAIGLHGICTVRHQIRGGY